MERKRERRRQEGERVNNRKINYIKSKFLARSLESALRKLGEISHECFAKGARSSFVTILR